MITINSSEMVSDLVGIILVAGLCYFVINWIRKPLGFFLDQMIADPQLSQKGVKLVILLILLEGVTIAVNFIKQNQLLQIFKGATQFVNGVASVIQWAIYIGALFFIAYSIRALSGMSSPRTTQPLSPPSPPSVNPAPIALQPPTAPVSPPVGGGQNPHQGLDDFFSKKP